jgi:hypothetical protein
VGSGGTPPSKPVDKIQDFANLAQPRGSGGMEQEDIEREAVVSRRRTATRTALMAGTVELFFATLPLLVFWVYWPDSGGYHPHSLWASAEIPMISCVIFGLSLIRWIQGNVVRASTLPDKDSGSRVVHLSAATIFVSIFPLLGIIFSCLSITQTMANAAESWSPFNLFLLFLSILMWYGLGGYGMYAGEPRGDEA